MTILQRQSYLITVTTNDRAQRTAMRNALARLGAREIWAGFFWVDLTAGERQALIRRFGRMARVRPG